MLFCEFCEIYKILNNTTDKKYKTIYLTDFINQRLKCFQDTNTDPIIILNLLSPKLHVKWKHFSNYKEIVSIVALAIGMEQDKLMQDLKIQEKNINREDTLVRKIKLLLIQEMKYNRLH